MGKQVREVMTETVVSATSSMTLRQLDDLLLRHRVSGAPVVDDGELVGVVSQTDIVRTLHDEQVAAQRVSDFHQSPFPIPIPALEKLARDRARIADRMVNLTVADIMSPDPVAVEAQTEIESAARLMLEETIHRLLVTDRGEVVGVVSALDLLSTIVDGSTD